MSENQPIHEREPFHPNHPGQHSFRRSIDSAVAKIGAWRQERTLAHEAGHSIDTIPQDEEIVLFNGGYTQESIWTPTDLNDPEELL